MKYIKFTPLILLVSFSAKIIHSGADFASMGIILGLCALSGYIEYKEQSKEIKEVKDRMNEITKVNDILTREIQEVKSYMTAARITDGLKNPLRKSF